MKEAPRLPELGASVLEAAVQYGANGWRVIRVWGTKGEECECGNPLCSSQGKHPVDYNWVEAATCDAETILQLFADSSHNVGLAMGGSARLFAVDIDGQKGEGSWAKLLEGVGIEEPETLESRTGRAGGGRHLLFVTPRGRDVPGNRSGGKGRPGLDVRGNGGQIVAAPSSHRSGRRYQWTRRIMPIEMDVRLFDALFAAPEKRRREHVGAVWEGEQAASLDDVEALLAVWIRLRLHELASMPPIEGTGRHGELWRCAKDIGRFVAGGRISARLARALLQEAGLSCGLSDDSELWHNIERGLDEVADEPSAVVLASEIEPLRNFKWTSELVERADGETAEKFVKEPIMLSKIVERVRAMFGEWPRKIAGSMFVPGARDGMRWLASATDFMSWLRGSAPVEWSRTAKGGVLLPSEAQLFSAVLDACEQVEALESVPHYPPIEGAYYLSSVEDGDGSALRDFVAMFNPASQLDRDLLEAALLTPFWGGPPGARPAFAITSEHGRGSGKTSTALAIAQVYGGALTINPREDWHRTIERLLSDSATSTRCAILDNLKGRLDLSNLEEAITNPDISGRKMYEGDAKRPNYITWFVTANTLMLSTDIASRSVIAQVGAPKHAVDFREAVRTFLNQHHSTLLGDIQARLRGAPIGRPEPDRFQTWQRAVLSRFENAKALSRLIQERRKLHDDDAQEGGEVAEALTTYLRGRGRDPASWEGLIATNELREALSHVWPGLTPRKLWARLSPLLGNGELKDTRRSNGGKAGRGLFWNTHLRKG